jgi:hypothetical protein
MTVLLVRLGLVAVFATAGIAKLADGDGVRRMIVALGFRETAAAALTWALVCSELGIAAALGVAPAARAGALASLGLLAGFSAMVAINVARGRRPECRCFGRLRAREIGSSTVARNAFFATGAGFVAAGGARPFAFAVAAAIVLATWLAFERRDTGTSRPGSPAPALALPDGNGRRWTLESLLRPGGRLLLVFSDPGCGACRELMPDLARWQHLLSVAVVSPRLPTEHASATDGQPLRTLLDDEGAVTAAYRIVATPSAVMIDAEGRIGAGPVAGADAIAGLVAGATAGDRGRAVGRRAVLGRAAVAVAGVTVVPMLESAVAVARTVAHAARPKRLKIDGAWLCDQRYALCTFAACKPSRTNPNISVCECKVKTGYSVGFKTCEKRAPNGRTLHSNFSLQDVTARTHSMKCSKRGLWVQCLDVVCQVDRNDPRHALCQCVNQRTKDFYTFGGNCKTETCSTVIWSATTAPFPGGAQLEKGLKRLGIRYRAPKPCPTATSRS